jgi:dipeptidyl aminopeptidase/acylaminoacyl peptidase
MGNGGSLAFFGAHLSVHLDAGRQVLALVYPGGGGIPGHVSEARLKAQALDAYDWLAAQHDGPLIVHGYSLGTGLALHVAANRDVDGIILDAPYARMCDVMTRASWLPACYLPGVQRWNSLAYADQIDAPVLVLHGTGDDLIPISDGQRLVDYLEIAGRNVQFVPLVGANHHNTAHHSDYTAQISDFLSE